MKFKILLMIAAAVFVQKANALDLSLPIDISSQSLEVSQEDFYASFTGNVKVQHGEVFLGAEKLDVYYAEDGKEDIKEVIATDKVVIVHGKSTATGDKAVYSPRVGNVLMTGNVVLTRAGSVLTGEKLVYNLETGHMALENSKPKGRVKATFSLKGK
tara:strand:+ start:21792 stop:22262 length:471 start_codon:yes stop_codon:yes gene_type:complete